LPPLENLTPEEMDELFGGWRQSFRPTFENLQGRLLTDAALGNTLVAQMAPQRTTRRSRSMW